MDLSTDLDFLSGALASVSGISLIPQHQSALKLDLGSFHAKTLQWVNFPSPPAQTQDRTQDAFVSSLAEKKHEQVFVKTLTGKSLVIYACLDTEVVDGFKLKIQDKEGVPPEQQRLMYQGKELEDNRKLKDYGVEKGKHIYYCNKNT